MSKEENKATTRLSKFQEIITKMINTYESKNKDYTSAMEEFIDKYNFVMHEFKNPAPEIVDVIKSTESFEIIQDLYMHLHKDQQPQILKKISNLVLKQILGQPCLVIF